MNFNAQTFFYIVRKTSTKTRVVVTLRGHGDVLQIHWSVN